MAKYSGTYACGHEGTTQIYGKVKYRQWKADQHFSGLCPECYEKKKQEEIEKQNQESMEKAKEMGLPELQGTEKQIEWANTIRMEFIEKAEEDIEKEARRFPYKKAGKTEEVKVMLYEALDYMLKNKTKASWYINNRNDYIISLLKKIAENMPTEEEKIEQELERQKEEEIKAEAIIQPEDKQYDTVAEIKVTDDKVSVYYPKNDDFYQKVKKELGYTWSGSQWEKKISYKTGSAEDRAAELGNKLLNAGFPIMILDPEIREKAINADYEPEHHRWISQRTSGDYEGWFTISWPYEDDFYSKARSLPGSRWSNPSVVVKPEYYKEVEEFAELYDFRFSPGAKEIIEKQKEKERIIEEKSIIVNPAEPKEKEYNDDGLQAILNSSDDVLDDLRDD